MNTMSLSGSDADKCEEPVVRNVYWLRFASEAEKMVQTTTGSDDFLMQLDNDNGFSCRIQSLETKFGNKVWNPDPKETLTLAENCDGNGGYTAALPSVFSQSVGILVPKSMPRGQQDQEMRTLMSSAYLRFF